jgi:MFS family permease
MTQVQVNQKWSNLALLRLNAFGFGITGFLMSMDTIVLPTLVLAVAPEGAKNTFLGALGLCGMVVAALVQPMVGWYSDRTNTPLGRRTPFILWSCVFVALGLSGLGFISNYSSLFVLWVFIQANASIGYGPFHALIRDLVPVDRMGVASSLKILADGAGGVTLIAVTGALIGHYTGRESVHWLWAALGIIAATLVSGAIISSLTVISRDRAARVSVGRRLESLRNRAGLHPHLPWFLISRYVMITAIFVFPTYGLFFLKDVVGAENPPQTFGIMILSIGGALVISVYPAGWLSDRIGRKPVVIFGGLAAALVSLLLVTADTTLEVVLMASVAGAAVGTVLSASWALANELGTEGREGQHMGIVNLATIAGAASAKVFGPGVDLLNLASPGYGYSALLFGCGAAFLVGALLIVPLNPRTRRAGGSPAQ